MNAENRLYQILIVIGTLAAAVLPTWIAVKVFREQAPERGIEVTTTFLSPKESLGSPYDSMELRLVAGDKTYSDITIASVQVRNKGSNPITDLEVKSPLTGTVPPGWNIVGVGEYPLTAGSTSSIKWELKGTDRISALQPFLLNAKESYTFPIYISKTSTSKDAAPSLMMNWNARVVGMKTLDAATYYQPTVQYATFPMESTAQPVVMLVPIDVAILLAIAASVLYCYFALILKMHANASPSRILLLLLLASSILAFCAAEVVTSMIRLNGLSIQDGAEWIIVLNIAIVTAASVFGLTLLYQARRTIIKAGTQRTAQNTANSADEPPKTDA